MDDMKVSYQSIVINRFSEGKIYPTEVLVLLTVHSEDSKDYLFNNHHLSNKIKSETFRNSLHFYQKSFQRKGMVEWSRNVVCINHSF